MSNYVNRIPPSKEKIDFIKLNESIAVNIEKILDFYNIKYIVYPNRVAFPCPIHNSDRNESLNVFTSGSTSVGNFVCWTNHCESDVGCGAFNLVKRLIESRSGHNATISQVLSTLESITGNTCPTEIAANRDIKSFNNLIEKINTIKPEEVRILATREYVKQHLTTPAEYYINRGFGRETLEHFDVGLCTKRKQEMFMRIVVPVYDITGKFLVGCVGRSINPECILCGRYHAVNRACPSNPIEEKWARKWINSQKFKTGHHLYSIWNAASIAKEKQKLIIVEGQGDVWRLYEAGINHAVGLFGNKMTDVQFSIIESLGITDIYLSLDTDKEGLRGRDRVSNRLSNYYNVHQIQLSAKDVGDMDIDSVKVAFKAAI